MSESGVKQDVASHHHQLREVRIRMRNQSERIDSLQNQIGKLVTTVDTLTDKLIEAGVLLKRKRK